MHDCFSPLIESVSADLLHRLIQAVPSPCDALQLSERAVHLLSEALAAPALSLYQMDAAESILRLLAQAPATSSFPETIALSSPVCASLVSLTRVCQSHTLFLLADLSESAQAELTALLTALLGRRIAGLLCVPLWCCDTFEGVLLAAFQDPLQIGEHARSILSSCGIYLASLLSTVRLQQMMALERQYAQDVLDQLPEGIVITEATSGLVRYANPLASQILGVVLCDLVGAPLQLPPHAIHRIMLSPMHSQAHAFWTFAVSRALSGKTLHRIETVVVRPDGTMLPVVCSSAPLHTIHGMLAGAILILQDITQQKRLEHDKNAFLTLASHELRTPLTSVLGYADVLTQVVSCKEIDAELAQVAAREISTQAEQMAFLIEEMLDLSSLDQDQFRLRVAPHDLLALLSQVREDQAKTTQKHQIHLLVDERASASCIAFIDAPRMVQILTNLVNNAIKYSPQGGTIEIGMHLEGQGEHHPPTHVRLWVKDQGLGIAQEDLPHLFERFYRSSRLDASLSGLGVGLYLVKQLLTRHGGRIWVESTMGQGATFFILLPLGETDHALANNQ